MRSTVSNYVLSASVLALAAAVVFQGIRPSFAQQPSTPPAPSVVCESAAAMTIDKTAEKIEEKLNEHRQAGRSHFTFTGEGYIYCAW